MVYSHLKLGPVNRTKLIARYTNGQERAAIAVRDQDKRYGIYFSLANKPQESHMKSIGVIVLSLLIVILVQDTSLASVTSIPKNMSEQSGKCISCHKKKTPSIVQQWGSSKHHGANVGCYECHQADEGDVDAFMHQKHLISIIVSPKDCGNCHEAAVLEMTESHHAKAARILKRSMITERLSSAIVIASCTAKHFAD